MSIEKNKYKIGDWVKLIDNIEPNKYYGGGSSFSTTYNEIEVQHLNGKKALIDFADGDQSYKIIFQGEHGQYSRYICEEIIEKKIRKPRATPVTEEQVEESKLEVFDELKESIEGNSKEFKKAMNSFDNINDSIKQLVNKINQRTLYDDAVKDEVINKVRNISIDELMEELKDKLNNFIEKEYGTLPKKIEIKNEEIEVSITGLFHKKFEQILKIVDKGVPLMLTGPAGAGKNHTLEQVAKALNLDFYFTNAITQEYKLTGFIDANGVYQETQFYKAFKDGGLFFLDEIDASCPESLIILNSAIANGYFDFPNGRVNVNDKFRVVCAGNTYGTGADMVYVGRNALDGATLDRFATIEFDYDEEVEKQLAYDDELFNFIKSLRKAIKDASLRYIVSMRATINATKLLQIGMSKKDILKSVIIKNMQIDDLNTIIKKINNNSEWKREMEAIKDVRN